MQDFILSFLAGMLTTLNPCVLPMLPFVLATALRHGRLGPLALVSGMAVTFTAVGLFVAAVGPSIGLSLGTLRISGAILMLALGVVMLMPLGQRAFATAMGPVADTASGFLDRFAPGGLAGQVLTGMLMGVIWSPCSGPTIGAAIGLASASGSLPKAGGMMLLFSLGAGAIMLALAYGTKELLTRRKAALMKVSSGSKTVLAIVFVAVGLFILTGLDKVIEAALVDAMPEWLLEFTTQI